MTTTIPGASPNSYAGDKKLFLLLIPCINTLNYYLTYEHIGFRWLTLLTFCIDVLQGYLAWLGIRYLILWLDRKIPITQQPVKRIITQVLLTFLTGTIIIILLTELVNFFASDKPVPITFYTTYIWIISIWFFVVNGIYIGLFYFNQWQQAQQLLRAQTIPDTQGFRVKSGKKELLLPYQAIKGCYVEQEYVMLIADEGRKFILDQSLDKLEKEFPSQYFFRLNRQFLVHREIISGFEKGENGKIRVLLKGVPQLPDNIPMSRTKAPAFKAWWQPTATT